MKIVFMGTPDFAVPTLEALYQSRHEVAAVVTQPDKPKGRGKAMAMPPVKEKALEYGIPVYQPVRVRKDEAFFEELTKIQPDVIVVIAFGQILPERILNLPKYGCINVHASLLPKYRGAAPIQWSIISGEQVTGVTTMQMDAGLDTGDMLLKTEVAITAEETGESLHDKLAKAGAALCVETLERLQDGTLKPEKQGESPTPYAKMLDKKMGNIDWTRPAAEIERLVRGLNSWPSAYTHWDKKVMKIWKAKVVSQADFDATIDVLKKTVPGTVVTVEKEHFLVQTGDGLLAVEELQIPGKKRMETSAFLRGYTFEEGTVLTDGSKE